MEGTSIEVVRLVVKEGTEEEYVIDLKKREVFPQKYESANNLTVSHSEKPEETFEVKKMACGGIITKSCGIIELPKTYGPGLDCTWTFNAAEPVEYKFDTFDVSVELTSCLLCTFSESFFRYRSRAMSSGSTTLRKPPSPKGKI